MRATAPKLLSYANRLSARPGEEVEFKVSCLDPGEYEASIVRLRHGDRNPAGPGFKEQEVESESHLGRHPARLQGIDQGSFVRIDDDGALALDGSFSFHAFVYPTTPERESQVIVGRWDLAEGGRALALGPSGVELWVGDGEAVSRVPSGAPLYPSCWYSVAAVFDADSGEATVACVPVLTGTNSVLGTVVEAPGAGLARAALDVAPASPEVPFTIAAAAAMDGFDAHFNGKIERPSVWGRALGAEELEAIAAGGLPTDGLLASWDFAAGIEDGALATDAVRDVGPQGLHGVCRNGPARAMTGVSWRGEEYRYANAPEQYGAIHFHDDDLEDCEWETDIAWRVPDDLPSGIYALKIQHGEAVDRLPVFVCPPRGEATADLVLVIPTASYLAYANERLGVAGAFVQSAMGHSPVLDLTDTYLHENPMLGLSLYDPHSDGSGSCLSSALRPIANLRPDRRTSMDEPWQFAADLHLVDWLEEKGIAYDVITDLELHQEGAELLGRYRVALAGSHPEYVSREILEAWEAHLATGGRGLYLGGNGYYWVTNWHPHKPHQIEVRRGESGTRAWEALPGELYLQTNGERGGLWRWRARPPQQLFGVGFATQGFDRGSHFLATPEATDSPGAFIFEGVDTEETIGDFGLALGGAAGLELDRYDLALGTPPNAALLAYSSGHSDVYQHVVEELGDSMISTGATTDYRARGDLVYFPTRGGGGMFSAGSISWCGSLSHNGYDNNVSRITENVLRRFLDPSPLEQDQDKR